MKILENKYARVSTCSECGAKLEINSADLHSGFKKFDDGIRYRTETYVCPCCGKENILTKKVFSDDKTKLDNIHIVRDKNSVLGVFLNEFDAIDFRHDWEKKYNCVTDLIEISNSKWKSFWDELNGYTSSVDKI